MREAFSKEIEKLAGADNRIIVLSGDIGNKMFDTFKINYPDRFYNCGISEANMTSMAAGLAMCGFKPVTYTITAFNTLRCLEQIRLDVCFQNMPVIIVGVGGGLSYASLNATHQALEDIACLRVLPNMTVICPGDAWEVRGAINAALNLNGPVYIRLAKKNEPLVHDKMPDFEIGKGIIVKSGTDICFLNTGNTLPIAMRVAAELTDSGISVQVVSMHTVKPLDQDLLKDVFSKFPHVVTIEEHSVSGGLGGSVAEWLSDQPPQKARLTRIGTPDKFMYEGGDQEHARQFFGISQDQIFAKIHNMMKSS
jgi:transketolase